MNYDDEYDGGQDRDETPEALPTYFIFAGQQYYPERAAGDFHSAYHSYEEAKAKAEELREEKGYGTHPRYDWVQLVELTPTGLRNIY